MKTMPNVFSPEGVKGTANRGSLSAPGAVKLAMAAAAQFTSDGTSKRVVVGRDTRLSGAMLECAVTAGFTAVGVQVELLGPVPLGAVSVRTATSAADFGVMIGGADDMYSVNGLMFMDAAGRPAGPAQHAGITAGLRECDHDMDVSSAGLGACFVDPAPTELYEDTIKSVLPAGSCLKGLRVVLDGAHGSTCGVAPRILRSLGAHVREVGCSPDGMNINRGAGVEAPWTLQEAVTANSADLGIALGGDGQRVVLADETGEVAESDEVLAVLAAWAQDHGRLPRAAVVGSERANFGLEQWLGSRGVRLVRSAEHPARLPHLVHEGRYDLAASASGHYVAPAAVPVSDGLLAGLVAAVRMAELRVPASSVLHPFEMVPQREMYVPGDSAALERQAVQHQILRIQTALGGEGRLFVKPAANGQHIHIVVQAQHIGRVDALLPDLLAAVRGEVTDRSVCEAKSAQPDQPVS